MATSQTFPPRFRRLCNLSAQAQLSWSQQHFCETAYDNRQHLTSLQHFKAKRLRLRGERRGAEASPASVSAVRPSARLMHQNAVHYVQKCKRERAFSAVGSKVSCRRADWTTAGSWQSFFFFRTHNKPHALSNYFYKFYCAYSQLFFTEKKKKRKTASVSNVHKMTLWYGLIS